MKLSEVFTASYRENPLCYWLRSILGIAACFFALFAVTNLANDAMPARDELTEISGHYLRLERDEEAESLYLYVETDSGLTERYLLESILNLDTAELSRVLTPGTAVTLRYQNDERRSVYELTAGDVTLLTYAQAEAADRENRYWGYGLVAALTAAALGLLAGWALWDRRRRTREKTARDAEKARRKEEEARLAAQKPVVYTSGERAAVERYVREAFGPIAQVFHEPPMHDIQLDIAVVEPSEQQSFYKLVTIGMGARRMEVPAALVDQNRAFAELSIFLPPEWKLLGSNEADTWPFFWLQRIARMPWAECDWLEAGHLFPARVPGSDFSAILLTWAPARPGNVNRLMLDGGRLINFYQLMPVFPSEADYRRERGSQRLWDRMVRSGVSPVVNLRRESCCDPDTWFEEDIAPLCWTEGRGEFDLGMEADALPNGIFAKAGWIGTGLDWERLARTFLQALRPEDVPFLQFASSRQAFFCSSRDRALLRRFALDFRDLCADEERAVELLKHSEPQEI
jgi:hypothetical protein